MSNNAKDLATLIKSRFSKLGTLVALYEYQEETGLLVYYRARFESKGSKEIRPFYWKNNELKMGEPLEFKGKGKLKPLYNLNKLFLSRRSSRVIWIAEGEKCVDLLNTKRVIATTAGGSNDINRTDWSILRRRNIVLWPDNDEPGITSFNALAVKLKTELDCSVKIVNISTLDLPKGGDVVDWLEKNPAGDVNTLELLEFEEPKDKHPIKEEEQVEESTGKEELFTTDEPWEEAVSGKECEKNLLTFFKSYCVLSHMQALAISRWVMSLYNIDDFDIFPRLLINSPMKRCGKTTLLECISCVVPRALPASNISPAAIYRIIEDYQPTLLIDEADTFINNKDSDIGGIINSGHKRRFAFTMRCVGKDHTPKRFSTWSPMAIAMIKQPQDTLVDRSIVISLDRKLTDVKIKKLRYNQEDMMKPLRRQLMRLALDKKELLRNLDLQETAEKYFASHKSDRANDQWTPLIACAHLDSKECATALAKAHVLLGSYEMADKNSEIELLEDIKEYLDDRPMEHKIPSQRLCDYLNIVLEDRPWSTFNYGKPLSQYNLSVLLKTFNIKSPRLLNLGGDKRARGYERADFEDSIKRYL